MEKKELEFNIKNDFPITPTKKTKTFFDENAKD
mgnify:CR=1 FL=1